MKRFERLGTLLLVLAFLGAGCSGVGEELPVENKEEVDFLQEALKDKGYGVELLHEETGFLQAKNIRIQVGFEDAIDLYVYRSPSDMKKDAAYISADGASYENLEKGERLEISWVSYPHFFKKGALIVLYVGENETLLEDLEEILGPQFAGY